MARFSYEQYEMIVGTSLNHYYDEDGLIDENETEEILYLWAIYDGRESHTQPIGYMHTAEQASMVCEALNKE